MQSFRKQIFGKDVGLVLYGNVVMGGCYKTAICFISDPKILVRRGVVIVMKPCSNLGIFQMSTNKGQDRIPNLQRTKLLDSRISDDFRLPWKTQEFFSATNSSNCKIHQKILQANLCATLNSICNDFYVIDHALYPCLCCTLYDTLGINIRILIANSVWIVEDAEKAEAQGGSSCAGSSSQEPGGVGIVEAGSAIRDYSQDGSCEF